jgi:hypothetical protein
MLSMRGTITSLSSERALGRAKVVVRQNEPIALDPRDSLAASHPRRASVVAERKGEDFVASRHYPTAADIACFPKGPVRSNASIEKRSDDQNIYDNC